MTTTVTGTPAPAPKDAPRLDLGASAMAGTAAKTDAAARRAFKIMNIEGQSYLVYVETKTADGKTFRHEATDAAFLELGTNFLTPLLGKSPPIHIEAQVVGDDLFVRTNASKEAQKLQNSGPLRSAFQAFTQHSELVEKTAPPEPEKKPEPKKEKPDEEKPEVKEKPFTPIDYAATELANVNETLSSETVATGLRMIRQLHNKGPVPLIRDNGACHEVSTLANLKINDGETFIPIRLGAQADAGHFVALRVKKEGNRTAIHYYDPKGRPMEQSGAFRDAYTQFASQFQNVTFTQYESSTPDQAANENTHCGAHVLRHYEQLIVPKLKAEIVPYRKDLSSRIQKFLKKLEQDKKLDEVRAPLVLKSIDELKYPSSPHYLPDQIATITFTETAPIDYALEATDKQPVIICTPRSKTDQELRRRSNLGDNNSHQEKSTLVGIARDTGSNLYKTSLLGSVRVTFTSNKATEESIYRALSDAAKNSAKELIIPVSSKEEFELYERILRLQELEGKFDSVTFTTETTTLARQLQRAWEEKHPPAPAPEPAPAPAPPSPAPAPVPAPSPKREPSDEEDPDDPNWTYL